MAKRSRSTPVSDPSPVAPAQERKWRARDALDTITRAAELQRDKTLMRDVKKLATEQVKNLQNVVKR